MAKETAEEKLLKMMQKSASAVAVKAPVAVAVLPKKKLKFNFTVGALNIILVTGIVVGCVAWGFEMRSGFDLLNASVEFASDTKTAALGDLALPSASSVDYYLRQIHERNIFKPYVLKISMKKAADGLVQRMSKYRLVGIAWLDLPETASVMIEDTHKNETFFLKQGEQLEGVTVKTIYTDRAVFSHENEETTIKL